MASSGCWRDLVPVPSERWAPGPRQGREDRERSALEQGVSLKPPWELWPWCPGPWCPAHVQAWAVQGLRGAPQARLHLPTHSPLSSCQICLQGGHTSGPAGGGPGSCAQAGTLPQPVPQEGRRAAGKRNPVGRSLTAPPVCASLDPTKALQLGRLSSVGPGRGRTPPVQPVGTYRQSAGDRGTTQEIPSGLGEEGVPATPGGFL